ncbi:MAG: 4a-hydroxytetrahydrobiopterin dehydratase [Verrucomicrobiales bacterium]
MSDLKSKSCKACGEATASLTADEAKKFKREIDASWEIINNHHLQRTFKFKNFKQALAYTNKLGDLAEAEGHHPDILLKWGEVQVTLYTHKVNGLTESDFVMAAKVDDLPIG